MKFLGIISVYRIYMLKMTQYCRWNLRPNNEEIYFTYELDDLILLE